MKQAFRRRCKISKSTEILKSNLDYKIYVSIVSYIVFFLFYSTVNL